MEPITNTFCFGTAIKYLKSGHKLQREGWNGKDMYVAYQRGYPEGIAIDHSIAKKYELPEGTVCFFQPYLMMKTADNTFVPWLASQTDLLAEDWRIVA